MRLTNVPLRDSDLMIVGIVDGDQIRIIARHSSGRGVYMGDLHIGEHAFKQPEVSRRWLADQFVMAIRSARDAGYNQALQKVRSVLEIKER